MGPFDTRLCPSSAAVHAEHGRRRKAVLGLERNPFKRPYQTYVSYFTPFITDSPPGKLSGQQVAVLLQTLVNRNQAAYEPPKQVSSVVLYWRKPEEWAEVLHSWVVVPCLCVCICPIDVFQAVATGQLNTILTFYEIQNPSLESDLSGIPTSLLRRAISVLTRTQRAQVIEGGDGDGVRFFSGI